MIMWLVPAKHLRDKKCSICRMFNPCLILVGYRRAGNWFILSGKAGL